MSYLVHNSTPAERVRGCIFSERFDSQTDVEKNNGVVTGVGTVTGGYGDFSSISNYIIYDNELTLSSSITVSVEADVNNSAGLYQTFINSRAGSGAANCWFEFGKNTTGGLYFYAGTVVSSTVAASDGKHNWAFTLDASGNLKFYEDGVQLGTTITGVSLGTKQNQIAVGCAQTSAVPFYGQSLLGKIYTLKIFNEVLTAEELLDVYQRDTYNYVNKYSAYYPLTIDKHDISNLRTLDASGKGNHMTIGDGSTSTTYPTKMSKRGYLFDGGDYFVIPTSTDFSFASTGMTIWWYGRLIATGVTALVVKGTTFNAADFAIFTSTATIAYRGYNAGASTSFANAITSCEKCLYVLRIGAGETVPELYVEGVQISSSGTGGAPGYSADRNIGVYAYNNGGAPQPNGSTLLEIGFAPYKMTKTQMQDLKIKVKSRQNEV